jgi:thiol-disulfide isomerase/thioredoxin
MEITKEDLKQKIENGEKLVIDFWAPWCGPCKVMKEYLKNIEMKIQKYNCSH